MREEMTEEDLMDLKKKKNGKKYVRDKNLAKTSHIDHNIIYEDYVLNLIKKITLSEVSIKSQGVVVNLNCEDDRYYYHNLQYGDREAHLNTFFSAYLQ